MNKKQKTGYDKRKEKADLERFVDSQRGALDVFFKPKSQISKNSGSLVKDNTKIDANNGETSADKNNRENSNVSKNSESLVRDNTKIDANNGETFVDKNNIENSNVVDDGNCGGGQHNSSVEPNGEGCCNVLLDIYVRKWNFLDSKSFDKLAITGPNRDISIVKGPKNSSSSSACFTRYLSNRETCDRDWLVYSKELNKVFCFCCKLFKKSPKKSSLCDDGFNNWAHINVRLKEHETNVGRRKFFPG